MEKPTSQRERQPNASALVSVQNSCRSSAGNATCESPIRKYWVRRYLGDPSPGGTTPCVRSELALKLSVMGSLGRLLIFAGVVLVAIGLLLMLVNKTNLPVGRLPGDITYRGKNTVVYFPLATSILVSIVLSLILYLIGRFRH